MKRIILDPKTMPNEARKLFRAGFPSYNGRKFKLVGHDGPMSVRSYWDGGSRDYYAFVRSDCVKLDVPAGSAFDNVQGVDSVDIRAGCVIVEHSIFCGKDMGLTLHVPADRLDGFRPAAVPLSESQGIVLAIVAGRKSAYRKEAAERRGVDIDAEKPALIALGLLRKNGAITPAGRNACADIRI
jgi:hypothetical protein